MQPLLVLLSTAGIRQCIIKKMKAKNRNKKISNNSSNLPFFLKKNAKFQVFKNLFIEFIILYNI